MKFKYWWCCNEISPAESCYIWCCEEVGAGIRVLCPEKLCESSSLCLYVNFSETSLGFDHTDYSSVLFTLYCAVSWFWTIIAELPLRVSQLVPCFVQIGTWLFLLTDLGTQFNC